MFKWNLEDLLSDFLVFDISQSQVKLPFLLLFTRRTLLLLFMAWRLENSKVLVNIFSDNASYINYGDHPLISVELFRQFSVLYQRYFSIHGTVLVIDSNKFIQILPIWHMNQLVRFSFAQVRGLDCIFYREKIILIESQNHTQQ